MKSLFSTFTATALLATVSTTAALSPLSSSEYSDKVKNCPGYAVSKTENTSNGGVRAYLNLASGACNGFGPDEKNLVLEAEYETKERLHVKIFDQDEKHFQVPNEIFERPQIDQDSSLSETSDLKFDYSESPFAFWISRRSDGDVLFDTRLSNIPAYNEPYEADDTSASVSVMPNHNLIFEPQYVQLSSALPQSANIYGLGEAIVPHFRRNSSYTRQTMYANDQGTPENGNVYGTHPFYIENRIKDNGSQSHGVFFLNTNPMEVWLRDGVIQYRTIGGIIDMYILSGGPQGDSPKEVVRNYVDLVGKPQLIPYWTLGFHLTRWGYTNDSYMREIVDKMREENIPLESQFVDIDYMDSYRDFTNDGNSFGKLREHVDYLHQNNQKFVPILDNAIPITMNDTDEYEPYTDGHEKDVFMKNPNGTEYIGRVWPGYTVFPDFYAENTYAWWRDSIKKWWDAIPFDSSIWLDMSEPSSFCSGSCGTGKGPLEEYQPEPVTDWPEGYDNTTSGSSGNYTIDGELTYMQKPKSNRRNQLGRRMGTLETVDGNIEAITLPPYTPHSGTPDAEPKLLGDHLVSTNATHANGFTEYDVHNANGHVAGIATHKALLELFPERRPFIIARSTFASGGKYMQHWLGDNYSRWDSMRASITGLFQFNSFGMPFIGADACGFGGHSDEELCTRWMMLAAFTPFYRNHNTFGAISQEPYVWDSTANATRKVIKARYELLPYFYSNLYQASLDGTPFIRPLWYEFPQEQQLLNQDEQFFAGDSILISPVLHPNQTSVEAYLPGDEPYYDWFTHQKVEKADEKVTFDTPLTDINVHVRGGNTLLLHSEQKYTVTETKQSPFKLLVTLDSTSTSNGFAYIDNGESVQGTNYTQIELHTKNNSIESVVKVNDYQIDQLLNEIVIVGVETKPQTVKNGDNEVEFEYDEAVKEITVKNLNQKLNDGFKLNWN